MPTYSRKLCSVLLCVLLLGLAGVRLLVPDSPDGSELVSSDDSLTPLPAAHPFVVCAACHGTSGQGNEQLMAPRLAGQRSVYLEAQIKAFQVGWRGADIQDAQGKLMADTLAALSQDQIDAALAYLKDQPFVAPVIPTATAHARGQYLYEKSCSICHGVSGEGSMVEAGIPRLDIQHSWYLEGQLRHFRTRLRGFHPDDALGNSMGFYAQLLPDDQAVSDVVAWITYQASESSRADSDELSLLQ